MTYNIGYGDIDGTGCIDFKENTWRDWFFRWVDNIPERYYAYIIKIDRGNGFSEQALRLLVDVAFNELGADKVFDDFPKSRISADKVFNKVGFKRVSDEIVELTKQDYLSKQTV